MVVVAEDKVFVVENMVVVIVFEDIGVLVQMLVVCTAVPSMVALYMEVVGRRLDRSFGKRLQVESNSEEKPWFLYIYISLFFFFEKAKAIVLM